MKEKILNSLKESIKVKQAIKSETIRQIEQIAKRIVKTYNKGQKVFIFGNGGSAADSQHIAAELVGRFKKERRAFSALALTTNTSIITALANDYNYDIIFERQIEALAKKNDLAIGISTSGKAKNVIFGLKKAKDLGLYCVALTGKGGSNLKAISDICVLVPSRNTARIQEVHITIGHIICELVEEMLS